VKLASDWREVLRKAWSIRLMLLAGLLSGVEVAVPFFADALPRGTFAALSAVSVAAAFVARLVAQKDLS
jgi:hypothetical protein